MNVNPKLFDGEPALIHYGHGATIKTGDFESERVYVSLTMPCEPTTASTAKTFKAVHAEVMGLLRKDIDAVLKDGGVLGRGAS